MSSEIHDTFWNVCKVCLRVRPVCCAGGEEAIGKDEGSLVCAACCFTEDHPGSSDTRIRDLTPTRDEVVAYLLRWRNLRLAKFFEHLMSCPRNHKDERTTCFMCREIERILTDGLLEAASRHFSRK